MAATQALWPLQACGRKIPTVLLARGVGTSEGFYLGFPSGPRRVTSQRPIAMSYGQGHRALEAWGPHVRKDARLALSLRRPILPGYAGVIGGCQACLIPASHHPTVTGPNQPTCLCNDPATLIVWACG